jgi:hypothetical protein
MRSYCGGEPVESQARGHWQRVTDPCGRWHQRAERRLNSGRRDDGGGRGEHRRASSLSEPVEVQAWLSTWPPPTPEPFKNPSLISICADPDKCETTARGTG